MSKQTAVEWLEETLTMLWGHDFYRFEFEEAKQMEKEQIINTGNCVAETVLIDDKNYNGNKYWNEFYGGDHE